MRVHQQKYPGVFHSPMLEFHSQSPDSMNAEMISSIN